MDRYKVTFTLEADPGADMSNILEAIEMHLTGGQEYVGLGDDGYGHVLIMVDESIAVEAINREGA